MWSGVLTLGKRTTLESGKSAISSLMRRAYHTRTCGHAPARGRFSAAMDGHEARALMERLNRDAARIAERFGLRYRAIEAERANVRSRYGVCYADGSIRIRLRHAATGRSLKYSSLVNTLCHELAHLRHFNHGPRFKAFYLRILDFARAQGIYEPGPLPRAAEPTRAEAALARAAPPRRPRGGDAPRGGDPRQLQLF